jgi:hypothetical protein
MTCAKQESNKILLQKKKKRTRTKQWQENIYKINVEQIESHNEFYIHLYLLGI